MEHTKGEWTFREINRSGEAVLDVDGEFFALVVFPMMKDKKATKANARLIAAAPDLLVVSHNLVETMGIDYAIKKLSTMSDDNMAIGAATILRGIQRQAKEATTKARQLTPDL